MSDGDSNDVSGTECILCYERRSKGGRIEEEMREVGGAGGDGRENERRVRGGDEV